MNLAHYFKTSKLISMGEALKLAWAKAKGSEYAAEISVVNVDRSVSRVFLFGASSDEVRIARIAYVNEIARERVALSWNNVRGVIGSSEYRLFQPVALPMRREIVSSKEYWARYA